MSSLEHHRDSARRSREHASSVRSSLEVALPLLNLLSDYQKTMESTAKAISELMSLKYYRETDFKETPIGLIPRDWDVVRLGDISEEIHSGIQGKTVLQPEGRETLRLLRISDIKDYKVDYNNIPFAEITEGRKDLEKYILKKGDLVIGRAGTPGVSALIDRDLENTVLGPNLIKVRLRGDVNPKYVHYFLQSKPYWRYIAMHQRGTLQQFIHLPDVKSLMIPLPPPHEQQRIVEILSIVDSTIQRINEMKARLESVKKELIDLLVTGRIRVIGVS